MVDYPAPAREPLAYNRYRTIRKRTGAKLRILTGKAIAGWHRVGVS